MYKCKQLDNREFATKGELFAALKANKADIIQLKKNTFKQCDTFGTKAIHGAFVTKKSGTDNKSATEINKTVIGNTYNFLDSHDDVHIDGIFTKSINENKKNILHLHDHIQQVAAKVGIPTNVYEKSVSWSDVGLQKAGTTTALLMDSNIIKDLNPSIFYQYANNEINQHSVGMQYLNLCLCVDSTDPEYKEDYANWIKYIPLVGNQQTAIDQGYFFAVTEAKLREISCVTAGSNELTGMYDDDNKSSIELSANNEDSTTKEPLNDTLEQPQEDSFIDWLHKTSLINI